MANYKLLCEERDTTLKAKQIRKKGYVTASVYGHHLDPINIQISDSELIKFLKAHTIGSKVLLKIGKDEHLAIYKESQREPVSNKVINIDFQALTAGEKIKVTVPIIFGNRDSLQSGEILQELLQEIDITTLPKHLVDHVDVDISKYNLGDTVQVSDLDISKDKNIEVLTPLDAQICTISHAAKITAEPESDEEPTAEPALVSEETEE